LSEFLTKSKFSRKVIDTVREHKSSYMDAVIHLCEEHEIDPADVRKFLSNVVKEKIEAEAQSLNYLKKGAELPV